jgi:hypothetical protein
VNALVVVRRTNFASLERMAGAMQAARYGARVEATILTEDEIAGASDAFPLLYDEIKRFHITLVGKAALADIVVHDTHRRFLIEQELREAQIGLRRVVSDALGAREAIGGAVRRKARQVRRPLRALLALRGISCKEDVGSVIERAGLYYSVDVTSLVCVAHDTTSRRSVSLAATQNAPEAAHDALSKLLAVAFADVAQIRTGANSLRVQAVHPRD